MVALPQSLALILARPNHVRTNLRRHSYDGALSVQQTLTGLHHHRLRHAPGRSDYNIYLIKTNATATHSGPGHSRRWLTTWFSVEQTVDGGMSLLATQLRAMARMSLPAQTNANGDTLWTRRYGGSDYDDGCGFSDDRRDFIIADSLLFGNGESNLPHQDGYAGYPMWTKTFGEGIGTRVGRSTDCRRRFHRIC